MAQHLNGIEFLLILRKLDNDELRLPVRELLEIYDQPLCDDCRRFHEDPWAAIACEERIDARRRREAQHTAHEAERRYRGQGLPPVAPNPYGPFADVG